MYEAELRSRTAESTARGRCLCLRQHYTLQAVAHFAAPLQRLYRLSQQGTGHVHAGARRSGPLFAPDREHHHRVQGQEEAGAPGAATVPVCLICDNEGEEEDIKGEENYS